MSGAACHLFCQMVIVVELKSERVTRGVKFFPLISSASLIPGYFSQASPSYLARLRISKTYLATTNGGSCVRRRDLGALCTKRYLPVSYSTGDYAVLSSSALAPANACGTLKNAMSSHHGLVFLTTAPCKYVFSHPSFFTKVSFPLFPWRKISNDCSQGRTRPFFFFSKLPDVLT